MVHRYELSFILLNVVLYIVCITMLKVLLFEGIDSWSVSWHLIFRPLDPILHPRLLVPFITFFIQDWYRHRLEIDINLTCYLKKEKCRFSGNRMKNWEFIDYRYNFIANIWILRNISHHLFLFCLFRLQYFNASSTIQYFFKFFIVSVKLLLSLN